MAPDEEDELMPYDHEHRGGGGGNDPRHDGIEQVVTTTLETLGMLTRKHGYCLDCMALQMAGSSLALFAIQQEAISIETGEVNQEKLQVLVQAVMDVAMEYAGKSVEGYKARKG